MICTRLRKKPVRQQCPLLVARNGHIEMSAIWLLSGASVLHSVDWVRFSREAHAPRSVDASAFRRIGSPQRPEISSALL